jgi:hypothetical protein
MTTGRYEGIAGAKVTKSGQFFLPGHFRVKINAVKEVLSQRGKDFTIIETTVVQSNNPDVPVGAERSQVIDMNNVMGLPNIKAFVSAVSGVDPTLDSVNDQVEAYWASQDEKGVKRSFAEIVEDLIVKYNVLEGVEMDLDCIAIKTQKGTPFTKHIWGVRKDA